MLAGRLHEFGDLRVEEVPDPAVGREDVLIDVACVQPSVTEAMLIAGERIALHEHLAARLRDGPVAFGGHEFAGVVSAVGSDVDCVHVGERVTAVETVTCGRCAPCHDGNPGLCVRPEFLGFSRPGAFAERLVVPARNVVTVPDGVSAGAVAAVQPLAGALHAHAAAAVQPGESVLVIGTGVMGLLAIQVARHGNAGTVVATGRSSAKLELARRFGADIVLGADEDVPARVLDATRGIGADVVIETAGGPPAAGLAADSTMTVAARSVRRSGRIVVVSVLSDDARLPVTLLRERCVTLLHPKSGAGGYSASGSVFEAGLAALARGSVDAETVIKHRLEGLPALPAAVEITREKHEHGAINPAQITTDHYWEAGNV